MTENTWGTDISTLKKGWKRKASPNSTCNEPLFIISVWCYIIPLETIKCYFAHMFNNF